MSQTPNNYRGREFLTTREAAERLGVSLRTAQLWVDSGVLEAWKTEGGHRRISIGSVERLMHIESNSEQGRSFTQTTAVDRLKILVVEDDNALLRLYRLYIAGWNLPVDLTTAANGYDALVLIGREQPDLMIVDLNMPGIDGFQMIRTLTSSSFREGMEIAVVTGMDAADIEARGGLPGDVRVFAKPVPINELKQLAQSMLDRRAALSQR